MKSGEDERFMRLALAEAERAFAAKEIPVGAVVARGGEAVAFGCNRREEKRSALAHAEVEAIAAACGRLGNWRLDGCTLYVTLEPCAMCAGAILGARISRVVFGAFDEAAGACGSAADLFAMRLGPSPAVTSGVLGRECGALLERFFSQMRR